MGCHPEEVATRPTKDLAVVLHHSSLPPIRITLGAMQRACSFTYIMASRSRTLYIGVTGDLFKRVFQHKWKEHEGFTARYNCDRLVWFERHQYVQSAIAREKELKGWSRSKKIALIESINPTWADLSREWYDYEPADYLRALDRMDS